MITVHRYEPSGKTKWDDFVSKARNGLFLFRRDYMDYHADRFKDHSLIVSEGNDWLTVLPANEDEGCITSHGGLTFGGFLISAEMGAERMLHCFDATREYMQKNGVRQFIYKAVPHIYHRYPAEEDLYALFRAKAELSRVDVSAAILQSARYPLSSGKKTGTHKAERTGVIIERSDHFEEFIALVAERLDEKYTTRPTHTAAEMRMLASRFPDRIQLFGAFQKGAMIAGVVLYLFDQVVHTQYIAANEAGRQLRATDALIAKCIEQFAEKKWFDFGHSNEKDGQFLNAGLVAQKEEFGARAIVHQTFRVAV